MTNPLQPSRLKAQTRVRDIAGFDIVATLAASGVRLQAQASNAGPGCTYAFYLMKGDKRVANRPYAPQATATFEAVAGPGDYHVRAFARRPGVEYTATANSRAVTIAMQAGALRRVDIGPLFHVSATGHAIRTEQLYLASNPTRAGTRPGTISFQPRADVKPYLIACPLDWSVDPYRDRNWNAQLHMWRMVDFMLLAAENSGNFERLRAFVDVALDWHRHHIIERNHSIYAWKDMMVGIRSMKLAYLVSQWQHGRITLDDTVIARLGELVETHLGFLLDPSEVRYSNHTLSDLHGAMALAQVVDLKTRTRIEAFVGKVLPKVLDAQFDRNGIHLEHSPGYHLYAIAYFRRLLVTGWFTNFGLEEIIAKAEAALPWFHLPDGRMAAIGDTDGSPPPAAVERSAFEGRDQVLNKSGYVIVRDDGGGDVRRASYLFFMGAYNSRFHKQADDLSVIWFQGEEILCDAGKYAYKTDETRGYVISRRAHNTVEIGRPADHELSGPPYGSAIEAVENHEWGHLIRGAVRFEASNVKQRRYCLVSLEGWLLLIDHMTSGSAHDYVQWSHFAPAITGFEAVEQGFDAMLSSGRRLCVRNASSSPAAMGLVRGSPAPRRQGWVSQAYRTVEPNATLSVSVHGKDVMLATLYAVDSDQSSLTFDGRTFSMVLHPRSNQRGRCLRMSVNGSAIQIDAT